MAIPTLRRLAAALIAVATVIAPAAFAAEAPRPLLRIVLMRHGVRSPTAGPAELAPYASRPWPAWPVAPGMLTPQQMMALKNATGAEFDRLFLTGMIQHHTGALTMVKDLFDAAGTGQDAELFNFATDVDSGQRAEIRIMESMLEKTPQGKKNDETHKHH